MKSVFLCHATEDKEIARKVASDLSLHGIKVWFDEWEMKVGDSLSTKIQEGIHTSAYMVVILSNISIRKPWVIKEINTGFAKELERNDVFVLPALVNGNLTDMPPFFLDKVYADFRDEYQLGIKQILDKVAPKGTEDSELYLLGHALAKMHKNETLKESFCFTYTDIYRNKDANRLFYVFRRPSQANCLKAFQEDFKLFQQALHKLVELSVVSLYSTDNLNATLKTDYYQERFYHEYYNCAKSFSDTKQVDELELNSYLNDGDLCIGVEITPFGHQVKKSLNWNFEKYLRK